jgi:hypothetical protein
VRRFNGNNNVLLDFDQFKCYFGNYHIKCGLPFKILCDTLGLFLNNEIDDLIAKQDFQHV